jgi:endonuclease/exonuclease/phosphatase family metal-dependent hydrolase
MSARPPTLPRSLMEALRKEAPRQLKFHDNDPCTTIASYNVHKCIGTDGIFDPARIAEVVGELNADVVALQEADMRIGSRQGLLDLAALERATELTPVHTESIGSSHGWHGNLILARNRVVESVKRIRLPGLEPRGALIVDLELKGVKLRIIAAHFGLLRRSRSLQASALIEATHSVIRPTILMGDLNEWRVGTRSSLLELLPHFGPLHAVLPSFPSRFPLLALDRILTRPPDLISSIEVHRTQLSRVASDHLPVKARLNLEKVRLIQAQPAQPDFA